MQNKFQTFGNRQATASPFFPAAQQQSATPAQPAPASQQPGTLNMSAYQTGSSTQTPFGSMPSLQAYQNQQDAFVQQFLQNQAQYNQGLMAGQQPQRVDLGKTWTQAGDMISQGAYQGNPFATGNVNALMGMFGQYGITPPQGLQDQLISQLGQQSAPPMYAPQPAFDVPRPINPGTGLPYGQPLTDGPIGPNGAAWHGGRMPQQPTQPAASAPPPAPPPPERAPWTPPPPPPGGWRSEQQRRDAEYQSRVQYMMNPGLNQDASPVRQPVVAEPEPQRPTTPSGKPKVQDRNGDFIDDITGERLYRKMPMPDTSNFGLDPGITAPGAAQPIPPSQQLPPGRMPDWGFPGYTQPGGRQYDPPGRPVMDTPPAAQPNPSDQWSYPLLPGMRRGPNGEQIMTEEARQAEIKRREQETGMRYVKPRAPGQTGGWLPAPKPASQAKDQSAAMAEYIRTQAAPGRASPTPTRTQGTRRR